MHACICPALHFFSGSSTCIYIYVSLHMQIAWVRLLARIKNIKHLLLWYNATVCISTPQHAYAIVKKILPVVIIRVSLLRSYSHFCFFDLVFMVRLINVFSIVNCFLH